MKKFGKLILAIILGVAFAVTAVACSSSATSEIDYANVESITVDETSIADGFLIADFNISKVILNVKYYDTVDNMNSTVTGETIQIPAEWNMVKAEDKAKLSVAGTHNVTLIYRKFEITFQIILMDSSTKKYKVTFLDEDGARLGDVQYVSEGGKATAPGLETKEGYDFLGWTNRYSGKLSDIGNISGDVTFVATYAPKTYKVGFYTKINGKEELITEKSVARGGDALDYAPEIPIIEGFSNGRWEDTESMKNVSREGLKFFAIYDADKVLVTFDYMRYGTAYSAHNISYAVGEEIKNPPEASREGYKFIEWQVDGKKVDFPYPVTTEITFKAIYVNITNGNAGLEYTATTGGLEICAYNGSEEVVVIPNEATLSGLGGMQPVVGIQDGVFKGKNIREFVVSEDNEYFNTEDNVLFNKDKTVLYFYPSAKTDGTYVLPASVVEVSNNAFYGANNLTAVVLNDSLKRIGEFAFAECGSIGSINITKEIEFIGEGAFSNAEVSSLTEVSFDDAMALAEIGNGAFAGNYNVTAIDLPSTLVKLGSAVFDGCKSLYGISALNNQYFTVVNGALYSTDKTKLYVYPARYGVSEGAGYGVGVFDPEVEIDESCLRIVSGAFSYAKISTVIITSNVTIEEGAFNCPTLRRVLFDTSDFSATISSFGDFLPEIVINANNMDVTVIGRINAEFGNSVVEYNANTWVDTRAYEDDFIFETYKYTEMVNGATVQKEGVRILGSRQSSTNLHIPTTLNNYSVTEIADYAFYGDNFIEKIFLPSDLRVIGTRAFSNMSKLVEISFNGTLISIGDFAFAGSSLLANVSADAGMSNVVSFGKSVFDGTAFIDDTSSDFLMVGEILVKYNGYGMEVTLPEGVEYIASDAFDRHGEITSIDFGESLRIVDARAFQYCAGIKEISFPYSLVEIRGEAFYKCYDLFVVNLDVASSDGKLTIADDAFLDADVDPLRVYTDTAKFGLTYRIDASDSFSVSGAAIVTPHKVDNTAKQRFGGWYKDSTFSELAIFPMELTADTMLYAKWIGVDESSAGIGYDLDENGTYVVDSYVGTDSYLIVPDTYLGKAVKEIGDGAFKNTNIVNVELPNSRNTSDGTWRSELTAIGEDAFINTPWYDNYSGDFVMIDDFLVKYKGSAKVVYIPNNVNKIARGAFKYNTEIEKVILSSNVTELDDNVFYGCTALKEIVLPSGLLSIGSGAFENCVSLEIINFSDCPGLSNVAYNAFFNTAWMENYIDPCIMINNILYKYQGTMTALHIYNGVISIGERAFADNKVIKRVHIPQSVTSIGISAFESSFIEEVNLYAGGSGLTLIQDRAFYNAVNLSTIDLSLAKKLAYIGEEAFYGCSLLKNVEIPADTTAIGAGAFAYSGLNRISFMAGSKITKIEDNTFLNCRSLYTVSFVGASELVEIGNHAFEGCIALEYFGNEKGQLSKIGDYAFYGCVSLTKFIVNEETLSETGDKSLDSVGFDTSEDGFVVFGNILIGYEGYETNIVIPANIITIYNGAFEGNSRIRKVTFAEGSRISNVNANAFKDCENLEEINFPNTIKYVGDDVVTGTAWMDTKVRDGEEFIIISNTLVKYNGVEPKRVVIPAEVEVINSGAFFGTAVFDITVGNNILIIEDGAFDGIDTVAFENWSLTILADNPPVIKEDTLISAKQILINSNEYKDLYRLDEGWRVQYSLVNVATKYDVSYVVNPDQGEAVASESLYALYEEKEVITKETEEKSYIFVGWYLDPEYNTAVSYPYVLTSDITLYAKCIDNTVGSNGENYVCDLVDDGADGYYVINRFAENDDNKIVILTEKSGKDIKEIGMGWIPDSVNGTHIFDEGNYIASPNGQYRQIGAFQDHTELTEVYFAIGSKITTIGKDAFKGCTNLEKIVLPASIVSIEEGAFENCTSLKEVVFSGNEELNIASGAFKNCTSLAEIRLPAGLKTIGDKAFENCTKLKDVYMEGDKPVAIGREDRPFEIVEGLRVHIKGSAINDYSAFWEAYTDYFVTDIAEE